MNALFEKYALECGTTNKPQVWFTRSELETFGRLVARRCIQVALDADDPFLAVEMGDLFGIDK